MATYLAFTKAALDTLAPAAKGKRDTYHDGGSSKSVPGLILRVSDVGNKVFYVYRWADGKPLKVKIGPFPEWSVDQARRKAEEYNGQLRAGNTPKSTTRRGELTVKRLWEWYFDTHAKVHKKETSWKGDRYLWQLHFGPLADTKISKLTRQEVRAWHVRIGTARDEDEELIAGPSAANKSLYLLRAMYNLARDFEIYDGNNPAEGIKPFKEVARRRRLAGEELKRFLKAVNDDHDQDAKDWILMCLYTGQRKGNVLGMRWEQIDQKRREWHIPETKNGEPLIVPLEDVELAILKRRKATAKSPWVFTGRIDPPKPDEKPKEPGHLVDGRKPWVRIVERAKIEDLHVHDLRRTHGSVMGDTGASLPTIGSALGHKDAASTKIYTHLDVSAVRAAKVAMLAEIAAATSPSAGGGGAS